MIKNSNFEGCLREISVGARNHQTQSEGTLEQSFKRVNTNLRVNKGGTTGLISRPLAKLI